MSYDEGDSKVKIEKEKYEELIIDVIVFSSEDVISASQTDPYEGEVVT